MDDQPPQKGVVEKLKDGLDAILGGNVDQAAEQTPELVGGQMGMDAHERRDIGMDVTDIESDPYGGSAASTSLEMGDESIPGTAPDEPGKHPPDSLGI